MVSVTKTSLPASISFCQSCKDFSTIPWRFKQGSYVYGCTVVFFTVKCSLIYKHIISVMEGEAVQTWRKFPFGDPNTTSALCLYLEILMWITAQNTFSCEVKVKWVSWLLNPCLSTPVDRNWHDYYHACLPPISQLTWFKLNAFFSAVTFILVWARLDGQWWGWSRWLKAIVVLSWSGIFWGGLHYPLQNMFLWINTNT